MKKISFLLFLLPILLTSCSDEKKDTPDAQAIISEAINKHGGKSYEQSVVQFNFRGRKYIRNREGINFAFKRIFADSAGNQVLDILNNQGFSRHIGDSTIGLSQKEKDNYSASVNSVIYFAFLPYRLNDASVNKKYIGETNINDKSYHKIEITFKPEGGGEDFDDVYVYWVHKQDYTVDYLAYSYAEEDGTGYRFREAFNRREAGGMIFQDYRNFKSAESKGLKPSEMDALFSKGKLELLSEIKLENLKVLDAEP